MMLAAPALGCASIGFFARPVPEVVLQLVFAHTLAVVIAAVALELDVTEDTFAGSSPIGSDEPSPCTSHDVARPNGARFR
jgi:hypothetical protein